jgi:DNA primase
MLDRTHVCHVASSDAIQRVGLLFSVSVLRHTSKVHHTPDLLDREGDIRRVFCRKESTLSQTFVDFKVVKDAVSIEAVFARYDIKLRRVNGHSLSGKCPLPTHQSDQSKESFIVQTTKKIWACQSSSCVAGRKGRKGGNILDFVAIMESCSVRDAAVKLQSWFLSTTAREESTQQKEIEKVSETVDDKNQIVEVNKPLSFRLKDVDPKHLYLRSRGLKEETVEHFGCGYFTGRGSMKGRVVIPIENERGELIAYAGRSIDASEPKYKMPTGFRKSDVLFNLNRVSKSDIVIVVEGFFDCMKVHQAGFQAVVALMGSSLSSRQQELLRAFEKIILFLDGNEAGRAATIEIAHQLMRSHFVRVISLSDNEQPDQLSSEKIKVVLSNN